jgi:hypothetical protein
MNAEPGYTTTEFWGTQAATLLAAVLLVLTLFNVIGWTEQQKAAVTALVLVVIAILQGLYALSRGIRKAATTSPVLPSSAPLPASGIKPAPGL